MWPGAFMAAMTIGSVWLSGCGGGQRGDLTTEQTVTRVPQAILVEKEISGEIDGLSLSSPTGVTVTRAGDIFFTDTGNHRLIKFTSDLELKTDIGGYGTGSNLFDKPTYITDDNQLNLLISDRGNRRVVRYTSQLVYVEEIDFSDPSDPLQFGEPSGLAVTPYGELWVADAERNRIAIFNNSGQFDRFIGDFGDRGGQMASPEKIVRTPEGGFLVCDAGNSRLVMFDQYGSFVREIKKDVFDYPMGADVTRDAIWVVDANQEEIYLLDRGGNVVYSAGPVLTGTSVALKGPTDIAVLDADRLLVCDSGNNRLLVCRVLYGEG